MKAPSILVLGGSGFIGHHLVGQCCQKDWDVTSLSLHQPRNERKVAGVIYLDGDLRSLNSAQSLLSGRSYDYVVNLTGYINHTLISDGGNQVIKEHFEVVQNLVEVLDWNRLRRFVQIGSSDEYGNSPAPQSENQREAPISPYSLGKLAATQYIQMLNRSEGFPGVTLRLFLTYGPGQDEKRFLPQIIRGCLENREFPVSAGRQLRDFSYVDDTVAAILLTLEAEHVVGEVINIASGEPVSIKEMIDVVCRIVGKGKPQFGEIPYRAGENMELYANISKAKSLLGWEPMTEYSVGFNETIKWISDRVM